jgi:2,3-bisphosphoglycerate-independent phosphoglycerate mutase
MSVIFIFIDGIGIGSEGDHNPLMDSRLKSIEELTDGQGLSSAANPVKNGSLYFNPVDANLEVEGLPQSGTGQATLFSGKNASKIAGRHYGPFPHTATRYLLESESLFHKILKSGLKPHFINAYPDIFFEKMNRLNRWTCTTLMASSAGQKLNGLAEIRKGESITAEIIQDAWREKLNLDVKQIYPEEAAERLVSRLDHFDLLMFEYYLTDKAGHSMSREMSDTILQTLDRFISHILKIKNRNDHLVISSDHGNIEDLSVKTHTRNPVPLIVQGDNITQIKKAQSIMDVPRVILDLLIPKRSDDSLG